MNISKHTARHFALWARWEKLALAVLRENGPFALEQFDALMKGAKRHQFFGCHDLLVDNPSINDGSFLNGGAR